MEEVKGFLCDNCRFITCMRMDAQGKRCGKEMPRKAKARMPESPTQYYICGNCDSTFFQKMNENTLEELRVLEVVFVHILFARHMPSLLHPEEHSCGIHPALAVRKWQSVSPAHPYYRTKFEPLWWW